MSLRIAFFAAVALLLSLSAFAQRVPVWQIVDTAHMQYQSLGHHIATASPADIASIGEAVGTPGADFRFDNVVRHSTDSGRTWKEIFSQKVQYGANWEIIEHPSPQLFIVAGDTSQYLGEDRNGNALDKYTGFFLISRDGGATWAPTYLDTNTTIRDLRMLSATYGVAILTHEGNVYDSLPNSLPDDLLITNDGWKTWAVQPMPQGVRWCWQLVSFGQGEFGTYTWSESDQAYRYYRISGSSVTPRGLLGNVYVQQIAFTSERNGWAAGRYWSGSRGWGAICHTTDGGRSWTTWIDSTSNTSGQQLRNIAFADSLHGFAAGDVILSTTDGGVTWNSSQPPYAVLQTYNGGLSLVDLAMPAPNLAIAIIGSAIVRFTGRTTITAPTFLNTGLGPVSIDPRTISWTSIESAQKYQVQLASNDLNTLQDSRHFFDTPWLDTVVTGTSLVMQNLEFNTGYYGRVRAISGSDTSDWSQSGTWQQSVALFYTITHAAPLPPAILEPPSGSHIGTHVSMKISSIPHAVSYGVRFYYYGTYATIDTTVPDTTFDIKGIQPDAQYDVTVRANFADDSTDWSRPNYSLIADPLSAVALTPSEQNPLLFPNPASEEIHIATAIGSIVTVFDALGRRQQVRVRYDTHGIVCDIGSLATGTYFATIEGEHPTTLRFVVRH